MCTPPLDLSFKDLSSTRAAVSEEPTQGRHPLTKNSDGKYETRSMRLSYNNLADTVGLELVLTYFLAEPYNLGWLDLSFNKLPYIDECICKLKELRVLHLHSNKIDTLTEVDKLGELQHLHTITLHGNPIETTSRDYR
ncbi:leucine-rich repeat-containing protein 51-like [Nematolebias whitei]|uniref:leucine-rich repeat-containing protein 51-like n=1 Tax=Nematolebias whitei TaxID=451745 RepID=UPI00189AAF48|nr:leucine-rich repeat-containing protein 51-like [Nematolebias whitei]